jgi:16S rRNA (guanine1516-N2)-methyltransferase
LEHIEQIEPDQLPDVIYLDPMFPERKKSASVKKEMQFFHEIIGKDEDSEGLIQSAIEKAIYRVAVKRPKIAGYLGNKKPTTQLLGKASRFDIYTKKKMPTQSND